MSLRPTETIDKFLISTTAHLTGEHESESMLLAHAWPDFYGNQQQVRALFEGEGARTVIVFAFAKAADNSSSGTIESDAGVDSEEVKKQGSTGSHLRDGDRICAYLSVLFGKRFDNHGPLQSQGRYHTPDTNVLSRGYNQALPQNSDNPRLDFEIPLQLTEAKRVEALFFDNSLSSSFRRTFDTAAKFYLQALQTVEHDPEIAYLHFITAGEVLSNHYNYDKDELLDEQLLSLIEEIRDEMDDGDRVAGEIKSRLLQVKRRFLKTIQRLVDDSFFTRSESQYAFAEFKREEFERTISAAYDLRSKYVHVGTPFGPWVSQTITERQVGKPDIEGGDFKKTLYRAPTVWGLERVIRYCLLNYASEHISALL